MIQRRVIVLAAVAALAAFLALPSSPALGATYVVDTTDDDAGIAQTACMGAADDCSLRGAITNANTASSPGDLITFDATVFNPDTIAIASVLPALTDGGDTIDGTGAAIVIIDGISRGFDCLVISSAGNTVKGLQLTDCGNAVVLTGTGDNNTIGPDNVMSDNNSGVVAFSGAEGNTIIGNKIGTNDAGTAIPAGNLVGINIVGGANNTVGGTSPGDRNIISGNGAGISFGSASATGNTVIGNFIGTDVTGTADLGNSTGVQLINSAPSNTIGGTAPGEANLISGNSSTNVSLSSSATGNTVAGNIIGPDINGSGASMVSGIGVRIQLAASNNTIGPRNVISDNTRGVQINSSGTTGNVVRGNLIGTNLAGTAGVPNATQGVWILTSASGNTIGGTGPGDGNVIAFNGDRGVEVNGVDPPSAVNNSIRGNSIHSNTGLEIDNVLGGNTELLPPILTSTLFGTVSGFACDCVVDIFSDISTDARFYEGSVVAVAGSFTFVNGGPFIGANITATRTDPSGNTSELAPTLIIDSDGDGTVDGTDDDDDNDGLLDFDDGCRVFPEDFDGFQDADGCPEPDNDLDGICDPGQSSVSCTGSDFGKTAFFPSPGGIHDHGDPASIDCRNLPEDLDGFKDGDGCPEPDNDNDGFPDATDDCPGTDIHAGADGALGPPEDFNHNGIQDSEAAFTSDDSVDTFEDYDGVIDTDGCHDSPGDDFDGDGFTDDAEVLFIGTDPRDGCADGATDEANPADLNNDTFFTSADLSLIAGVIGQAAPPAPARRDIAPATPDGFITSADLSQVAARIGQSCAP